MKQSGNSSATASQFPFFKSSPTLCGSSGKAKTTRNACAWWSHYFALFTPTLPLNCHPRSGNCSWEKNHLRPVEFRSAFCSSFRTVSSEEARDIRCVCGTLSCGRGRKKSSRSGAGVAPVLALRLLGLLSLHYPLFCSAIRSMRCFHRPTDCCD